MISNSEIIKAYNQIDIIVNPRKSSYLTNSVTPLKTIETQGLNAEIARLMKDEPCGGFVVGVPGLMVGSHTDSSVGINQFILFLEKTYPSLPVHQVDEGDTSNEAMSAMISGGMNKKNRREKGALDKVAAAIILQRFLQSR